MQTCSRAKHVRGLNRPTKPARVVRGLWLPGLWLPVSQNEDPATISMTLSTCVVLKTMGPGVIDYITAPHTWGYQNGT